MLIYICFGVIELSFWWITPVLYYNPNQTVLSAHPAEPVRHNRIILLPGPSAGARMLVRLSYDKFWEGEVERERTRLDIST